MDCNIFSNIGGENEKPTNEKMSEETHLDTKSLHAALFLIADIRRAVGDPTGKLMQDELVAHCGEVYKRAGMYDRLNESLAKNKRLFADEFAERVIESQKKRIHQLETELIEAKYQLRKESKWKSNN